MTLKRNGYSHIKVYAIRIERNRDKKVFWFKPNGSMLFSKNQDSEQLLRIFNNKKSHFERQGGTATIAPKWIWYDEESPYPHSGELF